MSVGEVCNRDVTVVSKDSAVQEAARIMRDFHVGDVVVIEERDGKRVPVGILTDRDIVLEIMAEDVPLESVTVGDIMSFDLLVAHESQDVLDVIEQMRTKGVRRVPVVDREGTLVGILTVDDIIGLMAEQLTDLVQLMVREQKREQRARP